MARERTRIMLADDHAVVRRGLSLMLSDEDDLEVVAEAADGAEAVDVAVRDGTIDVAVLDVTMPRLTGIQAARQILAHRPEVRVLILSMHDDEQFVFEALRAGAVGYVLKSAAHEDLAEACRAAVRGEPFLHPRAVAALVREYVAASEERRGDEVLTPRESEIVKLVAEGLTGREIAEVLSIAEKTVERHRENIVEKLGLRDRVALTRYAIRHGLVEP